MMDITREMDIRGEMNIADWLDITGVMVKRGIVDVVNNPAAARYPP